MRYPLLPALLMLVPAPADANAYRAQGKPVRVARTMTVTPPRDWNQLSARPGRKAEVWTLDGERLNAVTWFGGIAPGEALLREPRRRRTLPRYSDAMLLAEIPELLESTYRSAGGIADFTLTTAVPDPFLGHAGIRFGYAYVDADDLPRRGEARAAIVAGLLYIVTFDAPRTDYFDRLLGDVHRLTDSAAL